MYRLCFGMLLVLLVHVAIAPAEQPTPSNSSSLRPKLALQIGHNLPVLSVAFSPDGRWLASSSGDSTIKLWHVTTGAVRRTLIGHKGRVTSVAFSPDGKTLLSGSYDRTIKLWDVATGTVRHTLEGHEAPITSVCFSPDGKLLASGSNDKTVKLWDAAAGTIRRTLNDLQHWVASVAFSPDGRWLAGGGYNRIIKLWNVTTGSVQRTLNGHEASVTSLVFSPNGKTLASGSADQTIKLWDVMTGIVRRTLKGHRDRVLSVHFSPDGKLLASGSGDWIIKLWDMDTGAVRRTFDRQQDTLSVAFSPDGEMLASGSENNTIKLWDVTAGTVRRTLKGHQNLVSSVVFSPDGRWLANGSWDTNIRLWDVTTGAVRRIFVGNKWLAEPVVFSPDGKTLSSGNDRIIKLWDVDTGVVRRTLREHQYSANWVAFSPDGETLASGGGDKTINLWDVATGTVRRTLSGHENDVQLLSFSPDGKTLASVGDGEDTIKLWDVATGAVRRTLSGHEASVASLLFSPDGKTLASGSVDGTIKLWDASNWVVRRTLNVRIGVATSLAFSPDGGTLASVGANEVTLWDAGSGAIRHILREHEDLLFSVAFSPDGRRLASGSRDGTIKLWEPVSGRLLATMLTLPEVAEETLQARPLSLGTRDLSDAGAAISNEWFIVTPEGWFDCSANGARFIRWIVGNELVPAERYYRRLRRPDLVQQALRGEPVPEPDLTNNDVPPLANFVRLQHEGQIQEPVDGSMQAEFVTATLELQGRHEFKEIIVLVNGRPLPPEQERPLHVDQVPVDRTARPLDSGARAIELGAKAFDISAAQPADGTRGATLANRTNTRILSGYTLARRYTFRVPLPVGATEVRLRALAYDTADLGSNPTEIVLRSPDAKPVAGNLYVLCAGIGRYQNGSDDQSSEVTGFSNLKYPDEDVTAIAARFQEEGAPLYQKVEIFNGGPLLNEQVTLDNLRAGLKWLQQKARPGQIDTVVIYLSGHGLSDPQGRYYFPAYEFDQKNKENTSLSGQELQRELGGKLRARSVFLIVDTCHSGALAGARSDDLNFEVNSSGVYMLAASGATQSSYESEQWGHGAFTLALLRSLSRKELARHGIIHFNVLTYAVSDEVSRLMREVGQSETSMAPVVPLDGRRLDEPVAQAR